MSRLALDVAEQQRVHATGTQGEDDAGVVGHRAVGDPAPRAPHDGVDLAHREPVTGVEGDDGDAVRPRHAVDFGGRGCRFADRPDEQLHDPTP